MFNERSLMFSEWLKESWVGVAFIVLLVAALCWMLTRVGDPVSKTTMISGTMEGVTVLAGRFGRGPTVYAVRLPSGELITAGASDGSPPEIGTKVVVRLSETARGNHRYYVMPNAQ